MVIVKELNLSYEELQQLTEAGKLLGEIRDNKSNFDRLNNGVLEMLNALKDVISQCLGE